MKVLVVLHIAMLKGSGESDQSQEVKDRKNCVKNQALFSFSFRFFQWSSGSKVIAEECWTVKQGVFFVGCPSRLCKSLLLCHSRSFQLPFSCGHCLLFFHLTDLFQLKKIWRAYLVLCRQLLGKKENYLLLLLEHRVNENYTGICA